MPEPASSLPQPEPNEKLVKIFDTEQEERSHRRAGPTRIRRHRLRPEIHRPPSRACIPCVGGTLLLVREEDAPEAEKIIEAYRNYAASRRRDRRYPPGERAVRRITATGDIPSERARRALHGAHSLEHATPPAAKRHHRKARHVSAGKPNRDGRVPQGTAPLSAKFQPPPSPTSHPDKN